MNTLILNTTCRVIMGLLLVFSVFLLLRGHNLPGGGFSGGLVAASSFSLFALGYGVEAARRLLRIHPCTLIGIGLVVALVSAVVAPVWDLPFFTGLWDKNPLPVVGKLGTPLLFDTGVYIVVLGVVLQLVFSFSEEEPEKN
ncbi:MAG: Na+/H+ antiporter subunit B [Terrimicrobiaceae bacterium]|nr:Na+/H+ antiporter subunit B [Terrimicrobiaceae bacterium]